MVVMGVLSSWETLATKLRRTDSVIASEEAMLLSDMASWPISSFSVTGIFWLKSPLPKRWAQTAISRSGLTSRLVEG